MKAYESRPSKHTVRTIAAKVARRAGVNPEHLFSHLYERRIVELREKAQLRILRETGCSIGGLAHVWGCDRSQVVRATERAKQKVQRRPTMASLQFAATIRFLHPDRADAILTGNDPQTQADLHKWNSLGRRNAA